MSSPRITPTDANANKAADADDLISVIIPAYNVERYIFQTLLSVSVQTHRNLEIFVVDDGSIDATAAIIEQFAQTDPRIRLLKTEHKGVSAARNLAIEIARGQWIAPIDGDDIWHPEKLARQYAVARRSYPQVGVVYCWSSGIDDRGRVILPKWNASMAEGHVLRQIVVTGILGNGSTPLLRKSDLEVIGGYDPSLDVGEDWKLYIALAGRCEFAVVPDFLTGYRLRADSASMNLASIEEATNKVSDWIVTTWPELPADVLVARCYSINTYLAFLAIRQKSFRRALSFILKAIHARPGNLLSTSFAEICVLWLAHALGFRYYRWQFWRTPPAFGGGMNG